MNLQKTPKLMAFQVVCFACATSGAEAEFRELQQKWHHEWGDCRQWECLLPQLQGTKNTC